MARRSQKDKKRRLVEQVEQKARAAKRADPANPLTARSVVETTVELLRQRRNVPRSWPGARFTAHTIAAAVRPVVQEIRRQAFGTTAPFKSAEAFEEWAGPHVEAANARWLRGDETPAWLMSPYHRLRTEVQERLVPVTGWTTHFALQHVVLGTKYPGGFVASAHHSHDAPPWVQVTFYPWQLSEPYLQHLRAALGGLLRYHSARPAGGWGKPYAANELRFLDLLAEVGAPPRGAGKGRGVGRTEYWKRLSVAWGKRYKERVKPNALRMRWERFVDTHHEDARLVMASATDGKSEVEAPSGDRGGVDAASRL